MKNISCRTGRMTAKIYMEKVYDHHNWNFMKEHF